MQLDPTQLLEAPDPSLSASASAPVGDSAGAPAAGGFRAVLGAALGRDEGRAGAASAGPSRDEADAAAGRDEGSEPVEAPAEVVEAGTRTSQSGEAGAGAAALPPATGTAGDGAAAAVPGVPPTAGIPSDDLAGRTGPGPGEGMAEGVERRGAVAEVASRSAPSGATVAEGGARGGAAAGGEARVAATPGVAPTGSLSESVRAAADAGAETAAEPDSPAEPVADDSRSGVSEGLAREAGARSGSAARVVTTPASAAGADTSPGVAGESARPAEAEADRDGDQRRQGESRSAEAARHAAGRREPGDAPRAGAAGSPDGPPAPSPSAAAGLGGERLETLAGPTGPVAATSEAGTPETAGASGTLARGAAAEAIAVQAEWLATRGGGTARLLLNPPSLGEVSIRVTLRGEVVDVVMRVQEEAAKRIAEEQSERLAQAFSSRDLRIDQFEVRRGELEASTDGAARDFAASRDDRDGAAADGRARDARRLRTDGRARPDAIAAADPPALARAARASGGGVDLRI